MPIQRQFRLNVQQKIFLKNTHADNTEKVPVWSPDKRAVAVCFRMSERTGRLHHTL